MSITLSMSDAGSIVAGTLLASTVAVVLTIALVRLNGLRSFAKFAPHDFVVTVALGSVLAATAARSASLPEGLLGLASLFVVQGLISRFRERGDGTVVENPPVLLMAGERVLWDNMDRAHVTAADLRAKLREANVLAPEQVRAVVMEGTGDISVLHAHEADGTHLDTGLLRGVRGVDTVGSPVPWTDAADDRWLRRDA